MREIKFRAWDGETLLDWVVIKQTALNRCERGELGKFGLMYRLFTCDNVLMQYTGLKDKNGKDIYEGDVLKMEAFSPELNIVRFDRGGFCLEPILEAPLESHFWPDIKYAEDGGSEVIGNIYENPDLLT